MLHSSSSGGPGVVGGCSGGGMVRSPYNTGTYKCVYIFVPISTCVCVFAYMSMYRLVRNIPYTQFSDVYLTYFFIYTHILNTCTGSARSHYPTPPLLQSLLPASLSKLSSLLACRSPLSNRDNKGQNYDLNYDTEVSESFLEQYNILHDADTPASFPPTPFSRACVLNKSADRVNSVMFAAR